MAYNAIGKPTGAVEGLAKVSGGMVYAGDMNLPGTLWTKLLRSPYAHARIVSIDTAKARAMPGVIEVITGDDIGEVLVGTRMRDMPVLAYKKVRFAGEPVAAVAAESADIAEAALQVIDVRYEQLPAVFDALEALDPQAPRVHDDPTIYPNAPARDVTEPNVQSFTVWEHGALAEGFTGADLVYEHTFRTPLTIHGYMEPNTCIVWVQEDGKVDAWASNKVPYALRDMLVNQLGAEPGSVNVHVMPVGGDFGGKQSLVDAPLCYLLSKRCGRPVRLSHTYADELIAGPRRHPSVITLRTGVKRDGTLCAMDARVVFSGGAYAAFKVNPQVTVLGARQAGSCYRIPAIRVSEYCVYTNHVSCTQTRTPGGPQIVFAVESQIDLIARDLGMDPAAFRMQNMIKTGEPTPMGQVWSSVRGRETLQAAMDAAGWNRPKPARGFGRGVALYERPPGAGKSSASISMDTTGTATLSLSVADGGQGAYTVLQQIAAESLDLPLSKVRVQAADTNSLPFEAGLGGSKTTNSAGHATQQAAALINDALASAVAQEWGCSPEQVERRDGVFVGPDERLLSTEEAIILATKADHGLLSRTVAYDPPDTRTVTSFCAQIAEVEVDDETGKVKVQRLVTAHDVGMILNPIGHQGQINGGTIQGMGYGLCEETPIVNGRVATTNMSEFKLPNIQDLPELETVLLEELAGPVPYQGKAIGELPNVPTAAAIANAVQDAIGIRIFDLPVTAEKVYRAKTSDVA